MGRLSKSKELGLAFTGRPTVGNVGPRASECLPGQAIGAAMTIVPELPFDLLFL